MRVNASPERLIVAGVVSVVSFGTAVVVSRVVETQPEKTQLCASAGPGGHAVVHQCPVPSPWTTQSAVILALAALVAVVAILFRLNLIIVVAALITIFAFAWCLGDLSALWWSPPPTLENSTPPAEAVYFAYGALVGVLAGSAVMGLASGFLQRERSTSPA